MAGENNYKLLELSGEPYARGREYGLKCRDSINHLVEYYYSLLKKEKVSRKDARKHARKNLPYIEEYSPEIAWEMKGIAAGAKRHYEEIIMLSMHEEIKGFSAHNCTTFAVTGTVTVNNESYIGQTWDISKNLCENSGSFLLKLRREQVPDFLSYTYSGLIAGTGINSKGIAVVWNSVPRLKLQVGVPTYVIIEEILRQKTIGDAIAAVMRAKRAGCFNFVLADESEIYDIEATPEDIDISYSDTYIGHANHYISDKFKNKQDICKVAKDYSASTIIRHNRINRLLNEKSGNIGLDTCKDFLKDHVNYPESICRHPDPEKKKDARIITCASLVMVPARRELWITDGPACENQFKKYSIEREGDSE